MTKKILVSNRTSLKPAVFAEAVNAVGRQLREDFGPAWGLDFGCVPQDSATEEDVWGRVLVVPTEKECEPLHDDLLLSLRPLGVVVLSQLEDVPDFPWTAQLSQEVLSLCLDPYLSLLSRRGLAYEACDGVDGDTYETAGCEVSNFVLPAWFLRDLPHPEALVDFLGLRDEPGSLSPGGHKLFFEDEAEGFVEHLARRVPGPRRTPPRYSRRWRRTQK